MSLRTTPAPKRRGMLAPRSGSGAGMGMGMGMGESGVDPSVKGTIFANLIAELNDLIGSGKLRRAAVEAVLKPDEQDILDREVAISTWYPVDLYGRLLRVYASSSPGSERELLIEGGRNSARRVIELGVYSQLDDRTAESWENRVGRILVSLSGAFFSFGKWEWEGLQGDGFSIRVREAGPMTDELMLRTAGFVEQLACRSAGAPVALSHSREDDGQTVVFRAHRIT